MDTTTEQPTTAYALATDRFVTVVYRSDYTGTFRTCLKVDGHYIHTTDCGHDSEHIARAIAASNTAYDNGRRDQVYQHQTAEWVAQGEGR
jgi:hypothetical protein